MLYSIVVAEGDSPVEWMEELDVPEGEDPAAWCKRVIDNFNEVESNWYGEKAKLRRLIEVVKATEKLVHIWVKSNLVTLHDKSGYYDELQCERCGLKCRRYGLGDPPQTECHPERVCSLCGKEFASETGLKIHRTRMH